MTPVLLLTAASYLVIPANELGHWIDTYDGLGDAHAVASMPAGNGWAVLDADNARVSWPASPARKSLDLSPHLHRPRGLAIGSDGVIYAVDTAHHQVKAFHPDGQLICSFGGRSDKPGSLLRPHAVDVNDELVAVADTGQDRIQLYTRDGQHLGTLPLAHDELRGPHGVAIDDRDRIWITDTEQHRVLCVEQDGTIVHRLGTWGTFPGHFMEPTGIDARGGRVAVADRLNHRIQVFDADTGAMTEAWGMHAFRPREGEGKVHYPADAALIGDGTVVVAEPFEERVQHFGPDGMEIEPPSMAPRGAQSHFGPVAATSGRFFCTWEPEIRAIHLFDLERETPLRLSTFGSPGTGLGEIGNITALALDADAQRMWAVDASNRRLHEWSLTPPPADAPRFDPGLAVLSKSIPLPMAGPGTLLQLDDRLIFIDRSNAKAWQISDTGDHRPIRMDLGQDPRAAIVTQACSAGQNTVASLDGVQKRLRCHNELTSTTSATEWMTLDAVAEPVDMAVTAQGHLLIVDRAGHQIHRYDATGQHLGSWGEQGIDHEQFWRPAAIVIDRNDRVIVLDHGNHRAQMFTPDGTWLMTFGGGRAWRWGAGRRPETPPSNEVQEDSSR